MHHSLIVIFFGFLRFVVLYSFNKVIMMIVIVLVTDIFFLPRSSVIPFAARKFSEKINER